VLEHFASELVTIPVAPLLRTVVGTEEITEFGAQRNVPAVVLPLSDRDLKNDPSGQFGTEDIKCYVSFIEVVQLGDKVFYDSRSYTVKKIKPRLHGDFNILMCKLEVSNA